MKRITLMMVAMGLCALTQTASAEAPATAGTIQVGGTLGYAISMEDGDANPWGLGLGVHGGTTLDSGLYVGGLFLYHLGESSDVDLGFGMTAESTIAGHFLGVQLGYDVGISPELVIRPGAALGLHIATAEVCIGGTCMDDSENDLFLAPGAALLYVGDGFYVGPEARLNLVFADDTLKSLAVLLNGGGAF